MWRLIFIDHSVWLWNPKNLLVLFFNVWANFVQLGFSLRRRPPESCPVKSFPHLLLQFHILRWQIRRRKRFSPMILLFTITIRPLDACTGRRRRLVFLRDVASFSSLSPHLFAEPHWNFIDRQYQKVHHAAWKATTYCRALRRRSAGHLRKSPLFLNSIGRLVFQKRLLASPRRWSEEDALIHNVLTR